MFRHSLTTAMVVIASGAWLTSLHAQSAMPYPPMPSHDGSYSQMRMMPVSTSMPQPQAMPMQPHRQYPHLGAPMYPCPQQNIPMQVGGTMYTNQAFAPHEMLHAHEYRAMYPPFYYRVKGGWLWTPFGMESHDKWELMGTQVNVKYRSNYSLFSGFMPRMSR